jgi:hypothetical protein
MLAGALAGASKTITAAAASNRTPPLEKKPPFIECDKIVNVV